jgi:serine phosphatase RsbU (regulator of sigma subunit)
VLLVEDDEDDAILVADLLEEWPEFQLQAVASVEDAGAHLSRDDVHCVVLDLNLPDAVGFEALERLLAHDADVAVVVLTGDADGQRGAAAVAAGAQDYLVKGQIDAGTLVRAIRYAIERRTSERWRQEVAVVRAMEAENARLQRGLLPAPILTDRAFGLATAYRPGQRRQLLGGDFYDVVQTPDGTLHAMVGDVCGHGPDEASLGVRLRMAWRTLVLAGASEDGLLATLERLLGHERDDETVFTTLVQVSVAPDLRSATVRLAGHPPPMLLGPGGARLLSECASGPALGLDAGGPWPGTQIPLEPGWSLVLYTDGLFEGRAAAGRERLGIDGLTSLIGAGAADGTATDDEALHGLITEVERRHGGALSDDVAILALRAAQGADGPGSSTRSSQ